MSYFIAIVFFHSYPVLLQPNNVFTCLQQTKHQTKPNYIHTCVCLTYPYILTFITYTLPTTTHNLYHPYKPTPSFSPSSKHTLPFYPPILLYMLAVSLQHTSPHATHTPCTLYNYHTLCYVSRSPPYSLFLPTPNKNQNQSRPSLLSLVSCAVRVYHRLYGVCIGHVRTHTHITYPYTGNYNRPYLLSVCFTKLSWK